MRTSGPARPRDHRPDERRAEHHGLVKPAEVEQAYVVREPDAYPVNYVGQNECLQVLKNALGRISNLYPIGRAGQHQYNNQDHSLMDRDAGGPQLRKSARRALLDLECQTATPNIMKREKAHHRFLTRSHNSTKRTPSNAPPNFSHKAKNLRPRPKGRGTCALRSLRSLRVGHPARL